MSLFTVHKLVCVYLKNQDKSVSGVFIEWFRFGRKRKGFRFIYFIRANIGTDKKIFVNVCSKMSLKKKDSKMRDE